MNKYLKFCKKCMEGKMDPSKNYYVLDTDVEIEKNKNNNDIEIATISPTQAAVEQAKSEVREQMNINRGTNRKKFQIGGKDRGNSKSKRSFKRDNIKFVQKKGAPKSKEVKRNKSKKGDKKFNKKKVTSYRSIWM